MKIWIMLFGLFLMGQLSQLHAMTAIQKPANTPSSYSDKGSALNSNNHQKSLKQSQKIKKPKIKKPKMRNIVGKFYVALAVLLVLYLSGGLIAFVFAFIFVANISFLTYAVLAAFTIFYGYICHLFFQIFDKSWRREPQPIQ
jgi:hypothetical protein